MTDKQTIFLTWIVIFAVAFMGMVAVQEHVCSNQPIETSEYGVDIVDGKWITVNHTHSTDRVYHVSSYRFYSSEYTKPEQNVYDNESKFIVDVPDSVNKASSTSAVLDSHGFDNWSESDQELLTQMMQVTAESAFGIESELSFGELASIAPVHVLETYIDLLESAGY